jgi:hypothetical protein
MVKRLLILAVFVAVAAGAAHGMQDPIAKIREADLKSDLFALAGDAMRGREGGTLDEMAASAWVAERARQAGMLPAGDNGTYFQFFPLERLRVSPGSSVTLNGKVLRMGRDVVTDALVLANVDAPVTIVTGETFEGLALKDRVLVVRYAPAQQPTPELAPEVEPRCVPGSAGSSAASPHPRRPRSWPSSPTLRSSNGTASRRHSLAARTASTRTAPQSRALRRAGCPCSTCGSPRWASPSLQIRGWWRRFSPTASPIHP